MASQIIRLLQNEIREATKSQTIDVDSLTGKDLLRDGIAILPEALPLKICEEIRNLIANVEKQWPEKLWSDGADTRLFGVDKISEAARDFFYHPRVLSDLGWELSLQKVNGFAMLGRINASPNNLGSGGGWHRDSALVNQYKAIAYLTDVSWENGPFQYLAGSHKPLRVLSDSFEFGFKYNQYRFSNEEISSVIDKYPSRLKTLSAPAGTILLVNTRGIHRGKPIDIGTRYAITNYYFYDQLPPAHLIEMIKFQGKSGG